MSDMFYTIERCPLCRKVFAVYIGDPRDLSRADVDAVICPYCENKYLLDGVGEWTNLEDAYVEEGVSLQYLNEEYNKEAIK